MKKWAILIWYSFFVMVLLSFNTNPENFIMAVAFAVLIVPFSIMNILIAVIQLIKYRLKGKGILALLMILLSLYPLGCVYVFSGEKEATGEIKVLSFNASFFRIPTVYSPEYWNPKKPTTNDKLVDWIISQNADFVFIQEFFNDELSANFNNLKKIVESGGYNDFHYINEPRHDNGTSRGLIIFSRKPIARKRTIFLGENRFNGAEEILAVWGTDTLRLVNVHLKSSALEIKQGLKSVGGFKNEMRKFFNDGVQRGVQTKLVLDYLKNEQYPTLICGDFNSTRMSYVYSLMEENYDNTFSKEGSGFGFTFSGKLRLPVQIDHHFYSDGIVPRSINIVDSVSYSDHLPIMATYDIRQ